MSDSTGQMRSLLIFDTGSLSRISKLPRSHINKLGISFRVRKFGCRYPFTGWIGLYVAFLRLLLSKISLGSPMNIALATSCRVLIYGSDETLLRTRQEVLRFAGFPSDITTDGQSFMGHITETAREFHLFILCHSVPVNEQPSFALAAERAHVELMVLEGLVLPADFISAVRGLAAAC
jgi:hypothetical protein